jgi:hypothetical protein
MTLGTVVTFRHAFSGKILRGRVVGFQVQTSEIRVERLDDGSRLYIQASTIR